MSKNPSQRLQHIGDTRLFLEGALVAPEAKSEPAPARRGIGGKLLVAALAIALAVVAFPAALYFFNSPKPASQMRFEVSYPEMGQPRYFPGWAVGRLCCAAR